MEKPLQLSARERINKTSYYLAKKILFKIPPEKTHHGAITLGKKLSSHKLSKSLVSKVLNYQHPSLKQNILGMNFPNPIGLPGGFDKNAEIFPLAEDIGFGFVEIGSVTFKSYAGNPGTRLKRIPEKQALWVNMGLNNDGAKEIKKRIKKIRIPLGINIAKTNCSENALTKNGIRDYIESFKILKDKADYFTLNISCPNAFGGQPFTNPKDYEALLVQLDKLKISAPIFTKLSPDLDKKTILNLIEISNQHNIQGFVCSNLTKRSGQKGSYSGQFLKQKSNNLIKYVYKKTRNKRRNYIIIGSGGISSAEDAYEKIKLGASLVQLITGMIYQGPSLIGEINHGLVQLLKADGFTNISQAVGLDNK